jgi:hypothetical protein
VDRALEGAFGTRTYESATPLGGIRAFVCRIVVAGRPYLLRIGASTHVEPAFEIAATRLGASAELSPRVLFADATDRVMITDYIEQAPRPADFALRIAPLIARVHALPPWPRTLHHIDMLESMMTVCAVRTDLDDLVAAAAELGAVYPRDVDRVACHNDLKGPNILFDGTRPWIIDWEASFNNDRYADLANPASFFVPHDRAAEAAFLAAYFGAPATEYQHARFVCARFANHAAYVFFLSMATVGAHVPPQPTPDYDAFHAGIIDETEDLADPATKVRYGNVHLAAARQMMQDGLATALDVVQQGP